VHEPDVSGADARRTGYSLDFFSTPISGIWSPWSEVDDTQPRRQEYYGSEEVYSGAVIWPLFLEGRFGGGAKNPEIVE
jgi:hypothetical protein